MSQKRPVPALSSTIHEDLALVNTATELIQNVQDRPSEIIDHKIKKSVQLHIRVKVLNDRKFARLNAKAWYTTAKIKLSISSPTKLHEERATGVNCWRIQWHPQLPLLPRHLQGLLDQQDLARFCNGTIDSTTARRGPSRLVSQQGICR